MPLYAEASWNSSIILSTFQITIAIFHLRRKCFTHGVGLNVSYLIEKQLASFVDQITAPFDNIVVLKYNGILPCEERDSIVFCADIPPKNLPYYDRVTISDTYLTCFYHLSFC